MLKTLILIFSLYIVVYSQEYSQLTEIFKDGYFTEGPAYSNDDCIYFSDITFTEDTDMQAGIIWKHDTRTGNTSVYRSPSGMANGIAFDQYNNMIVCEGADYGGRRITSTDLNTGRSKILTALFNNRPYNSPNDLVIDNKSNIYFTDPRYAGYERIEQSCFGVYLLKSGEDVRLVIDSISMPNGIALSPLQDKIYIGCNYEGDPTSLQGFQANIYVYDLDENGLPVNGKVFIEYPGAAGPDGMTTDKEGNLYVALRDESDPGIYIYNSNGEILNKISLPEVPSNLTFGKGINKNYLYITAGGGLYKIKLSTEGNN